MTQLPESMRDSVVCSDADASLASADAGDMRDSVVCADADGSYTCKAETATSPGL